MKVYPDSSLSDTRETLKMIEDRQRALVPEETQDALGELQTIQAWLVDLIYKQRKYNRHAPHLGYPVWFGRAVRDLEKAELAIDEAQAAIRNHINIQYN